MGTSDSDDSPHTRKRARREGSGDGSNGKKQRGRPRVDTQDETAADRRRTQIRLAQRAYRQRKETTISALKSRVTELESAVDDMNQAFLRFNDTAMTSGLLNLKPEVARELKKTTETFVKLAKEAARKAALDGDDDLEDELVTETALVKKDAPRKQAQLAKTPEQPAEQLDIGWGYSQMYELQNTQAKATQEMQIASYLSGLPTQDDPLQAQQMLPFGLIADPSDLSPSQTPFQQFNVRVPTPPLGMDFLSTPSLTKTATIKAPYTYSFQEPTLARRLQRAALERGYHLLSSSTHRPSVYKHVFRLALLSSTREQLIGRFKTLLAKSNVESLDYWQSPYIHIGGAGTHYPQRDPNGNIVPKPNSWTVNGMGPFPPLVKLFSNTGIVREVEIDLRGYEGEWFDPHDVQGYLEEVKHCVINPHSSFAEAWIDDVPPATEIDTMASPLAMDLGMNIAPMEPQSFFPPIPSTRGVTPVNSSLSSSRSSSGSESIFTGNSTPPTPNMGELVYDMSSITSGDKGGYLGLDTAVANTLGAFSNVAQVNMASTISPIDKPFADILPGPGLHDGFSFETGGVYNGDSTDFDNVFDLLSPKSITTKFPSKKLVTVDVNKMIEELCHRGVCLGRSPGFRRADVDLAFNRSVIQAF